MKYTKHILLLVILFLQIRMHAANDTTAITTDEMAEFERLYSEYLDSISRTLVYETEEVTLKKNLAKISLPAGFKYLNGEDSEMILTDLWGNPPSQSADKSLGMLIPIDMDPVTDVGYTINITYAKEGYVDDSDAKDINYDKLLKTMQKESTEANKYRKKEGYPTVELVGWASPPYYDADEKKLHWAKELYFEGEESNTLNYNIRILGRKGYLQLNAIGEIDVLDEVNAVIDHILASVAFTDGNKYSDFNPEMDKIAAYGIGGLIAGKVLLKAGIFAKLGILLVKFWKLVVLGIIGIGAAIRNVFKRRKADEV